jgi:DNA-binding response OmpR family regulator
MRILFIDDDAVFANALSEMLEEQNIQVDQAECGESGHELADIYDYQAIVLDLGLPDMNRQRCFERITQKWRRNAGYHLVRSDRD